MNLNMTKIFSHQNNKKQKKAVSTAHFCKKRLEIIKKAIKEAGLLESRNMLEKYVTRIIYGNCYVYGNKTKVLRLPEEKNELYSYLEEDNPEEEIVVDLSCIATCLFVGKGQMYTLMKKH